MFYKKMFYNFNSPSDFELATLLGNILFYASKPETTKKINISNFVENNEL